MITGPERVLPDFLAARARDFVASEQAAVAPRLAATVALLRDASDGSGIEVYVLRRVASMAFAAGMHVFPGGTVDGRDIDHATGWVGPPPTVWAELFGVDEPLARGLVLAAVRETFEESGVLLAGRRSEDVVAVITDDSWEADRRSLVDHSLSFADMLDRRRLAVRADLLRAWACWVTPEFEPRRYDTAFFVAAMPAGQQTRAVGGEADQVAWVRPREILAALAAGDVRMLPPTAVVLGEIAEHDNVEAVLRAAEHRQITPIMPRPVLTADGAYLVLPGEPGYDR
jgi:8-oxo-dGTP pyrophosphatase MutT (NUDIX family)